MHWYAAKLLYIYFPFYCAEYHKESVLKGHDLIKLITLTASSRTFFKQWWHFYYFLLQVCSTTTSVVWCHCLDSCYSTNSSIHQCFCIFSAKKFSTLWKKADNILVLFIKIVWPCGPSEGVLATLSNQQAIENCCPRVHKKFVKNQTLTTSLVYI